MIGSISGGSIQTTMLAQLAQKMFSMTDQDGSGSISKSELTDASGQESSAIDAFFSKTDSDQSESITQQEFASMLSQMFQEMKSGASGGMTDTGAPPPPPPDSSGMISSMDTSGDGSLSVDEMTAGGVPDAARIFSEIDTDGDGLATQDELDAFGEKMKANGPQGMASAPPPPPPPQDSGGMFSSLDTDSDGYLTVDELSAGNVPDADKIFSEIDTDSDGKISQTESDAFDEKMKANGPQSSTTAGGTDSSDSLQTDLLNLLIEMIAQNKSYTNSATEGTSILA